MPASRTRFGSSSRLTYFGWSKSEHWHCHLNTWLKQSIREADFEGRLFRNITILTAECYVHGSTYYLWKFYFISFLFLLDREGLKWIEEKIAFHEVKCISRIGSFYHSFRYGRELWGNRGTLIGSVNFIVRPKISLGLLLAFTDAI